MTETTTISLDLSHNDPERLLSEFVNPLRVLAESMVLIEFFSSRDRKIVGSVHVYPVIGSSVAFIFVFFRKDGSAELGVFGSETREVNWSEAAEALVRAVMKRGQEEIAHIEERVRPALVELNVLFASQLSVPKA